MYLKIKAQIKEAMKEKNNFKRDAFKMVIDKAKAIMKEKNPTNTSENIPDDVIVQAIQKEIKQLKQTKEALKDRENSTLYAETVYKMAILSEYLPREMTKEEVEKAVYNILSNGDYRGFGEKMKAVMCELRGKADNKIIKEVVETYK